MRLLEVARAVIDSPRLLLLDEPTSGLAQRDTEVLGQVITELGKSTGCSFLLVEHDIEFVFGVTERVLVLLTGKLLADASPDGIARDPAVIDAYLGAMGSEQGRTI
jgi:branched-chain amino acid transport system ATP-binding protein